MDSNKNVSIMTPHQLKQRHEATYPNSFFFSKEILHRSGDSMGNYKVLMGSEFIELHRKTPVKNGRQDVAYYNKTNYMREA